MMFLFLVFFFVCEYYTDFSGVFGRFLLLHVSISFLLIFILMIINNFKFKYVYLITLYSGVTKFAYVSLAIRLSVCFSICMTYRPGIKLSK